MAEAGARFDPSIDDLAFDGTHLDEVAVMQLLMLWREQAWRNAEAIVNAPTPEARAAVLAGIERLAAIEANLIVAATSYSPLNLPGALSQLGSLLADPVRVLQAPPARPLHVLTGALRPPFTSGPPTPPP